MNDKQKFSFISNRKLSILIILFFSTLIYSTIFAQDEQSKIGVLALRGAEEAVNRWTPTAEYLSDQIPEYSFVIVPLNFEEIYNVVENDEVDFVLANPFIYVVLEYLYKVDRIATLKDLWQEQAYDQYGGVIFIGKNLKNISNLNDMKNVLFMATHEISFGGWRMVQREFMDFGIDPYSDFGSLQFSGTHDEVVYAVQNGEVDAGIVRTGVLEKMNEEGKIDINDFTIINQQYPDNFSLLISTRLYPEWPFSKVRHTSDQLAEQVSIALLSLSSTSKVARNAGIAGWTIPHHYMSVHECLKELRVSPYEDLGKITLTNLIQQYLYWILFGFIGVIILIFVIIYISRLNRKLNISTSELKEARDRLEQKVAERTSELKKHRDHLEELVEERTKELEAFAYSVSHDLKAPLRAIDGFTRILMDDYIKKLDEEAIRLTTIVQSNSQKMGLLIKDLLRFFHIGKKEMRFSNIDMKKMVNAIYNEAITPEEQKRIKFTLDDLPNAKGDPDLMRQVWLNLISNALKFSANCQQAVISVTCKEEKNKLIYCIKDNGAGFNLKYKDKLFGVFQRLHSEKEFEGTGVGLALVQRIIYRHDGEVWAEGEVDKGAAFYFSLPKK